jgi:predicted AlkP superfamily pyrophosphatase or phosphodiesterase
MRRPGKDASQRKRQALRHVPSGRRASPPRDEKVILVLVDAVGYQAALESFGTIESLVEFGLARRWCMRSVLPSLSAPVYETLHTGTPPHIHGIRSNDRVVLSKGPHVFGLLRQAGRPTGAVAHYFFSELYNKAPYEPLRDMEVDDPALDIRHGRFYSEQGYSKANLNLPSNLDLFTRATLMIRRDRPDYLLIHSFAPDSVGHIYGADSKEYRDEIWSIDNAMAEVIHLWREEGYRILVTADHGQTPDGRHGGTTDVERLVPFYDIGNPIGGVAEGIVDQLSVAPTILSILGLRPPPEMRAAPLAGVFAASERS